jgi:hypothetical protein
MASQTFGGWFMAAQTFVILRWLAQQALEGRAAVIGTFGAQRHSITMRQ